MLKKECALHVAANMGAVDATKNFKLKVVFALPDVWCAKHRITSAIKTSTIDNVCLPKSKAERKKKQQHRNNILNLIIYPQRHL